MIKSILEDSENVYNREVRESKFKSPYMQEKIEISGKNPDFAYYALCLFRTAGFLLIR